jgi:hypothetical protein
MNNILRNAMNNKERYEQYQEEISSLPSLSLEALRLRESNYR